MKKSGTFSPFTPLPNQSRTSSLYNSSTIGMFKQSPIESPLQAYYIRLDGVNEENNLSLYNFFNSYGDILSYYKNSREGYIILRYKSEGCVRRATNAWSMKSTNFPNVSLRLITEEERNKVTQENYTSSNQYYYHNPKNEYYVDKKSNWMKFFEVLFNL